MHGATLRCSIMLTSHPALPSLSSRSHSDTLASAAVWPDVIKGFYSVMFFVCSCDVLHTVHAFSCTPTPSENVAPMARALAQELLWPKELT